jgi:hypothetical protein
LCANQHMMKLISARKKSISCEGILGRALTPMTVTEKAKTEMSMSRTAGLTGAPYQIHRGLPNLTSAFYAGNRLRLNEDGWSNKSNGDGSALAPIPD